MKNSSFKSFLFLSTLFFAVIIFSSCAKENDVINPIKTEAEAERPSVTFNATPSTYGDAPDVDKKLKYEIDMSVRGTDQVPTKVEDAVEGGE